MCPDKHPDEGYPDDPTLRAQEEELEELLGQLPQMKAPPSLRAEVMAELRATPPSLGLRFRQWWASLGVMRYAIQLAPVAALVAFVVIARDQLQPPPLHPDQVAMMNQVGEMDALGLDEEPVKTSEPALVPPKPDEPARIAEQSAATEIALNDAVTAPPGELNETFSYSRNPDLSISPDDRQVESVEIATLREEVLESSVSSFDMASAPPPAPTAPAVEGTMAIRSQSVIAEETPSQPMDLARAVEENDEVMPDAMSDFAAAGGLPTQPETEIAFNLPEPEPIPAPSAIGPITSQRVERIDREVEEIQRQRQSMNRTIQSEGQPTNAMGFADGQAITPEDMRSYRERAVAYEPMAPNATRSVVETVPTVRIDATNPETYTAQIEAAINELGGRVTNRSALTVDRDVWQVDAQVPRWRLESAQRRLSAMGDQRLTGLQQQVEERLPDPRSLTSRDRQLMPIKIIISELPERPNE